MSTAGSPPLLTYPLVARGLTSGATVIEVRGRRIGEGSFGVRQIRVGELERLADEIRALVV